MTYLSYNTTANWSPFQRLILHLRLWSCIHSQTIFLRPCVQERMMWRKNIFRVDYIRVMTPKSTASLLSHDLEKVLSSFFPAFEKMNSEKAHMSPGDMCRMKLRFVRPKRHNFPGQLNPCLNRQWSDVNLAVFNTRFYKHSECPDVWDYVKLYKTSKKQLLAARYKPPSKYKKTYETLKIWFCGEIFWKKVLIIKATGQMIVSFN